MRKLSLLLVLLTFSWVAEYAQAQPGNIYYASRRRFTIPFGDNLPPRLRSLNLFVSTDQGRSWQLRANAQPGKKQFEFTTDQDGFYWFTVQTVDMDGRLNPPSLDLAVPSLKVVVDTVPPVVKLQPLPPRGNNDIGVGWKIHEDYLDSSLPDALRLEYRLAGNQSWTPLPVALGAQQHYWNPLAVGKVEVRLKVRDQAGNWGEDTITIGGGSGIDPGPQVVNPQIGNAPPLAPDRKFVNSKRITLNYDLDSVGPSGISLVELWFTLDGRTWNKYTQKTGDDLAQKSITFDVVGEGLYGLTLIARSGVGRGPRPPQIGDRPQIWIEVDCTKPVVQLHSVQVGDGADKGKVTINWSASDKNLQREPITLSYAESRDGPWTPIAQTLPNTRRYVWNFPEKNCPYQFYVKVAAADMAGNVGEAITPELVRVDLSVPNVINIGVKPGGK